MKVSLPFKKKKIIYTVYRCPDIFSNTNFLLAAIQVEYAYLKLVSKQLEISCNDAKNIYIFFLHYLFHVKRAGVQLNALPPVDTFYNYFNLKIHLQVLLFNCATSWTPELAYFYSSLYFSTNQII